MAFFSEKDLDELRSRADIVQVIGEKIPLKKSGRNFKGLCPFHDEKSPSFMVHPEKQIFHCFGCGEGGDLFSFLMKHDGLEFVEAVEQLAERYGVVMAKGSGAEADQIRKTRAEKDLLWRINRLACRFFYEQLTQGEAGQKARGYLTRRRINDEMVQEALLGYAPGTGRGLTQLFLEKKVPMDQALKLGLVRRGENGDIYDFFRDRLIFTILSADGKILGFSGRGLEDSVQPKYLNSPESSVYRKSDSLLGIAAARSAIRSEDRAILVEGNFDMLRLHQEGLRPVVAPLGTALTDLQVRSLAKITRNFVLLFDGDTAGIKAAERALPIFLPLGLSPKVVLLPEGEDPDSFVLKKGIAPLKEMILKASSLLEVRVEHILKEKGRDPERQVAAIKEISELLVLLPGEVEKMLYIQRLATRFGLSEDLLAPRRFSKKGRNFSEQTGDDRGRNLPPIERTVLEILLSGHLNLTNPGLLFEAIEVQDFSDPDLGEVWQVLKEEFRQSKTLDLAKVLNVLSPGPLRHLVTELAMSGSRWQAEGDQMAADCVRQLRVMRIKGRLKGLSQEIREAESSHDRARIQELLEQKTKLMKEIATVH